MSEIREIHIKEIVDKIAESFKQACYVMRPDIVAALEHVRDTEISDRACHAIDDVLENAEMARKENLPFCHDTGVAIFLVKIGQDVHIVGGSLTEALNEGVRRGYTDGYLRASIVKDLFDRINTKDNTPAIIHYEVVSGDQLTILHTSKGGGSENKSRLVMLKPSDGVEGIKKLAVETVSLAGASACPPVIVGIGAGGTFDYSAFLAKKALFREVGSANCDPKLAALEDEIHEECNKLGIGPQGMGGINTVLDVFIEVWPCHIASLPAAVNLQCPAQRHGKVVI